MPVTTSRKKSSSLPQAPTLIDARTLPHNLEAEKSVLGAVVTSNTLWGTVAAVLARDDFFRDAHRRIFDTMVTLVADGRPIDYVTLIEALRVAGHLDDVGGPAYITSLTDGVPKSTNVPHYAAIVKEKKRLRDVIHAANRALDEAYGDAPSSGIIETHVRDLLTIGATSQTDAVTIGASVTQYITAFDATSEGGTGIKLGFVDVDQFFAGGVARRQLMLIAGRPSMGKTTIAANIAENLASAGLPVGFFSIEMDRMALAEQAIARASAVDVHRLKTRHLGERDWAHIAHALETLALLPIYIIESVRTYTQFDAWCRRLRDEHGIAAVVVDHIQLMGDAQTRDRRQEIDYLSRSLKRTAQDLDLLVIGISQLSRAPEGRADKRPTLSDLRESGGLEQDADIVLLIFRPEAYDPQSEHAGIAEIIIAKNRTGPVGVGRLAFIKEQLRFADLAVS